MIAFPEVHAGSHEFVSLIPVAPGFDVSWVGSGSVFGEFCIGSDRGSLQFLDANGTLTFGLKSAAPSGEAINGGAFIGRWMSVSTSCEVVVFTFPQVSGNDIEQASIPVGAHDVIAGLHGSFFAPLGRMGLLHYQPREGGLQSVTVSSPTSGEELYIYRVISVKDQKNREIVACATRWGGVAALQYQGEDAQNRVSTRTFAGLDVVDICPLNADRNPSGAIAIGRDGTIIVFQDVLNDAAPRTIKYPGIRGVVYRVLSIRGHLFVLTSKGLYIIAELVELALRGESGKYVTPVLAMAMEAIDAYLVADKWVMVVLPEAMLRFDLSLLGGLSQVNGVGSQFTDAQPILSSPVWQQRELVQSARQVAAAVAG